MISAKIIADSLAPSGVRLTTFVVVYPRFILAEVNTHRAFSRNSASSRAIPIRKMISDILKNPAKPISWGANGKGMQAKKELLKSRQIIANLAWMTACWFACGLSWAMSKIGVHKQIANRITEPFAHMTTIVTATEFENFFALRAHPDAQPEFQDLAYKMLEEYKKSVPAKLKDGEWHLPFGDKYAQEGLTQEQMLKIVTARCARVSYLNFEGDIKHEKDYALHDDLLKSGHLSPFEHAGRAESNLSQSGNFRGFTQYRKLFANESRKFF